MRFGSASLVSHRYPNVPASQYALSRGIETGTSAERVKGLALHAGDSKTRCTTSLTGQTGPNKPPGTGVPLSTCQPTRLHLGKFQRRMMDGTEREEGKRQEHAGTDRKQW